MARTLFTIHKHLRMIPTADSLMAAACYSLLPPPWMSHGPPFQLMSFRWRFRVSKSSHRDVLGWSLFTFHRLLGNRVRGMTIWKRLPLICSPSELPASKFSTAANPFSM